jgi:hypothetical protein
MVNLRYRHPQNQARVLDSAEDSLNEEARSGEESNESC